MHFFVLGASGRTGQLVVQDALKRGHTLTALVRKASSIKAQDGVTTMEGTPLNKQDIQTAFQSTCDRIDSVIVALNASRVSDSPFAKPLAPLDFIRDCVRNATEVMTENDVKRIVIMSAFGIGSSWQQLPWLMKLVFKHTNMSFQMQDHEHLDADMHANERLDWTLVRPMMLKEGEAAPVKEFGETGAGAGMLSGVTRASVAKFLVQVAEDQAWAKKAVVIAN